MYKSLQSYHATNKLAIGYFDLYESKEIGTKILIDSKLFW
tara:strand:+ start:257 stop:376 length:120 start_codon:yes stop_codon:yes gene_type:complete